jgi:uncharacterized membrane protein (UPF0127 family)
MAARRTNNPVVYIAIFLVVIVAVIAVALAVGESKPKATTPRSSSACGPYRSDLTVKISGQTFQTEVAKSQVELDKGLGGRPCILQNQAMLLYFSKPGVIQIWMKDMKFPIDVLWIASDHKVVAEEVNLSPKTYPDKFINKDRQAQYVLEVKANRSKQLHVGLGTEVQF